jgi:FkbH-like protein
MSEMKSAEMRVAVVGDTPTQLISSNLKKQLDILGFNPEIMDADYDQVHAMMLNTSSEVYGFNPHFIVLFQSSYKLYKKFVHTPYDERKNFAETIVAGIENLWQTAGQHSKAKIIYPNFQEWDDGVLGNYGAVEPSSFIFQIRKLNLLLAESVRQFSHVLMLDLNLMQSRSGYHHLHDPRIFVNTEIIFSLDFMAEFTQALTSIIKAVKGNVKKCLILDLDDTVWGGIIGDDGMENIQIGNLGIGKAFSELQQWAKELKERGIILAVCSKNTESIAREPFEKHPDMILRPDDITVFMANWENKVDNIRQIQAMLNIGFDSMVFIDDNPFERNFVRKEIPALEVPEIPEDPAERMAYLKSLNLFETVSLTNEDRERVKMYSQDLKREHAKKSFASEDEYLQSLGMTSVVQSFTPFNIPRIAQLTQRSNQFNLRTIRYTEDDVKRMAADPAFITLSFTLIDTYGDNGLICVIILEKKSTFAFIDTWIMSCRVLKRGMENFVLNTIVKAAREAGCTHLKGEYLPTAKNGIVKDHYKSLGFTFENNYWILDLHSFENRKTFITPAP